MNTVLLLIIVLKLKVTSAIIGNADFIQNEISQLEVRAVIIKCELSEEEFHLDSEAMRFQREELFKHNALRDCKKKLAVTIKMLSDPNQSSGDEYIPIEHVLGANKRKIRLLNPYVLRLRRKSPFQAYKLRRIDTVRGVITKSYKKESVLRTNESRRIQRDLQLRSIMDEDISFGQSPVFKLDHDSNGHHSYSIKIRDLKQPLHKITSKSKTSIMVENNFVEHKYPCPKNNDSSNPSSPHKRHIKDYEYNFARTWTPVDLKLEKLRQTYDNNFKQLSNPIIERQPHRFHNEDKEPLLQDLYNSDNSEYEGLLDNAEKFTKRFYSNVENEVKKIAHTSETYHQLSDRSLIEKDSNQQLKHDTVFNQIKFKKGETIFALYEIGDPDLWFTAQIQLFEKLSNPGGKTVWNDLTKDKKAIVSTSNPEWSNEDFDVQYKPAEFIARDDFILPLKELCLVVPLKDSLENSFKDKSGEFIIVPSEDVIRLGDEQDINKRDENSSDFIVTTGVAKKQNTNSVQRQYLKMVVLYSTMSDILSLTLSMYIVANKPDTVLLDRFARRTLKSHRLVTIRATRALMGGGMDSLKILSRGASKYLKLPHTKPHYAQIDLEARADDNELILVGVLGRLTTVVSDTTRKTRSILTVQATNTGLAAARFRVITRECNPELLDNGMKRDETVAGPVLLPPRHTKNFQLNLPLEIPIDNTNCIVALVNEKDESIAVRDVRIKYGDRCFCVWHCDCVCLTEDPKLLCRDMTSAQLLAAGLSTQHVSRHTRSTCYPDVVTLNLFVTFIGVLFALLLLGTVKAFLGLVCRCVALWGLQLLLQMPRKLDHYYECSLRDRRVVYDSEGWPIHPDTKERTVRLVSRPMEFILNLIFFLTLPCIMIWDALKKLASRCQAVKGKSDAKNRKNGDKNCFSSHDVQVLEQFRKEQTYGLDIQQELHFWREGMEMLYRRRRGGLRRWMTPHAEELTTGIWQKGLAPIGNNQSECLRPLLREENCFRKPCEQVSFVDSEQDDTEYILMQMQKSKESLARTKEQKERKTGVKNINVGSKKR